MRRSLKILTLAILASSLAAPRAPAAPLDERVIMWNGVTPAFLSALSSVAPYRLVYTYEIIKGAAVEVSPSDTDDVIRFARHRSLNASGDALVRTSLSQAASTVHVKGSGMAWSLGYSGKGSTIAVLDTGMFAGHKGLDDLDDNAATTDPKILAFRDFANRGGDAVAPYDDEGHGTFTSGIAAGTGEGTTGNGPRAHAHVGIAYEANLVGLKVLGSGGLGYSSDVVAGVNWAALNKNSVNPAIRVLNMSLGAAPSDGNNDGTSAMSAAVDAATNDHDLVVAVAAGNGDSDGLAPNQTPGNISIPGDARTAITACASDSAQPPSAPWYADWDSEGPTSDGRIKPDVCAPGEDVQSTSGGTDNLSNSTTAYRRGGGTSASTPHVAGIAALIIQAVPSITAPQVKDVILRTARNYSSSAPNSGKDNYRGFGEAQAKAAIDLAKSLYGGAPSPLSVRTTGPYSTIQGRSVTVTGTAIGGSPGYTFAWDLNNDGLYETNGSQVSFSNTSTPGTKTIRVRATDSSGATAIDITTVEVAAVIFRDDVESGTNGWVAASSGAPAAGWHITDWEYVSPTHAWYHGDETTHTYGRNENVTLTRTFNLATGPAASAAQIGLEFTYFADVLQSSDEHLHVNVRPSGSGPFTELWEHPNDDFAEQTTQLLDITAYRGSSVDIQFQFTSGSPFIPCGTCTGVIVDDIGILAWAQAVDAIAPAAITNLAPEVSGADVTLRWAAPGDDGTTGTATSYDVRRSTSAITATNFALAQSVPASAPKAAGSPEELTVTGLATENTYYFAVKAVDEAGNTSPISNVVYAYVGTPPPVPAPVITSPAQNQLRPMKFDITGTATPGATVHVYRDAQPGSFAQATTAANGTWRVSMVSGLSDGSHTIQATATTANGTSLFSQPVTFNVDAFAPTLTVLSPSSGRVYSPVSPLVASGRAADTRGIDRITLRYRNTVTGAQIERLATCGGGSCTGKTDTDWSDTPALFAGSYTLSISVYDLAGNIMGSGLIGFVVIGA